MLNQGTYQQAGADRSWAFELVGDLWPEDSIESDLDEENDDGLGVPATSDQIAEGEKTEASVVSQSK